MSPMYNSGGAATQAGIDYQNRVAAWMAVRILAEQDASPPWNLPDNVTLDLLRCETEQPIDDLLVGTSEGGHTFAQVKHGLRLEKGASSPLALAVDQFVRQFVVCRSAVTGNHPWERPLDGRRDRLLLIVDLSSSASIRHNLATALNSLRQLPSVQPMASAAKSRPEQDALAIIRAHLVRSWQAVMGTLPTDGDIYELLCLVRVETLDVDEGGTAERESENCLRSSVLQDPTQSGAAWNTLVQACAGYARARSGADRKRLQQVLQDAHILLKAPRSYRDDIERLQRVSRSTVDAVSELSQIHVGSVEVKIARPSTFVLRNAVEAGSLVVVGEPGAGKSGALHDIAKILQDERRDVVFFAVDRLEASSLGALKAEIGLAHDLGEVLENWPGREPGFVIIDALDAARSDASAQTLRHLIADILKVPSRWRVVASIRKFDLRYSQELQQVFSGEPLTEFRDSAFARVRHINIPRLSDDELAQIPAQSPELGELIAKSSPGLHELLRVIFNLRLLAELLGDGVAVESLTPIRTQIELLDRYWQERVIRSDSQGYTREAVLRQVTEKMVESRSLRVSWTVVAPGPATGPALMEVLRSHVLIEWRPSPDATPDRYVLTFAHHVLFDYAVACLLLRGVPEDLIGHLERDRELVLAIRPSLVLHFQHVWLRDPSRAFFWDLVCGVMHTATVPEVGKLIGPSVAAELLTQMSDCEPLFHALEDTDSGMHNAAEHALRHLVGSILADAGRPRVGPDAGPWCELLERASRSMRAPVAYAIRGLLSTLCEKPDAFTTAQRSSAGIAARRLLEFAWYQPQRDNWLVIHALEAVCRTFESDASASAGFLRRCLEPTQVAQHGYEELPWLAREVKRLIPLDPELVQDIYRTTFTYHEKRRDLETPMGSGRILPMISNAQQDYESARYELAETFPTFLNTSPVQATRALVSALDAYVAERHPLDSANGIEETFEFNGQGVVIRTDYSAIWDTGHTSRYHEAIKMLDTFEEFLRQLADDAWRGNECREVLEVLVRENRLAVLWRRLLACGAAAPRTLGREIRFLAWATPILTGYDTTHEAGNFLNAVFGILDLHDRERIERTILAIPDTVEQRHQEFAEHTRDRLLGCLPIETIVTGKARSLVQRMADQGGAPPNQPPFQITGWTGKPYEEREYLAEERVPVDEEPNRRIQMLEQPVKEFAGKYLNATPPVDEIEPLLPTLRALYTALQRANTEGVHPKQCDYAWDSLAEACEHIARVGELSCETEAGSFARDVLLEAGNYPEPIHHPERDAHFDDHPSWGRPAARIPAAMGLTWLARLPFCTDNAVLNAIDQLSRDNVPAVRFQVAARLLALYRTAPALMWSILERMCHEELSRGVLQGLLADSLGRLAGPHADRVAPLVKTVFDRIVDGPGAQEVRESCVSIFTGLFVWQNNPLCRDVVFFIADRPVESADEAHRIVADLREVMRHGPVEPPELEQDQVRQRAFALMRQVLRSTIVAYRVIETNHSKVPFESWPEQEKEQIRTLARLANAIGREIYYASGAFNNKQSRSNAAETIPSQQERMRFLREAGPILDELADLGFPSLVHHLLQTLEFLVIADPQDVFLRIGHIVHSGKPYGYQYESLAADLVVHLVERYLAEYRHVLRENEECRRVLLQILDIFVEVGWPSARRLTYRMEEIFR